MGPTEAGVSEAPSKRPPAFRESLQRLLTAAAPASGASKEPTTDRSTEAEESTHARMQQGGVPATASQEADVATQSGKGPVLTPGSSVKVQEAPPAASQAPASAVHTAAKTTPGLLVAQKKETTSNVAEGTGPLLL